MLRVAMEWNIKVIPYGRGKGGVSAVFGYSQVCIVCFRRRHLSPLSFLHHHRSRYSKIWTQRTIQTAIRVAVIMQSTLRWPCVLSFLVSCGFNLTLWSSIPVLLCGISFNSVSSMGPESDSCNAARLLFLP